MQLTPEENFRIFGELYVEIRELRRENANLNVMTSRCNKQEIEINALKADNAREFARWKSTNDALQVFANNDGLREVKKELEKENARLKDELNLQSCKQNDEYTPLKSRYDMACGQRDRLMKENGALAVENFTLKNENESLRIAADGKELNELRQKYDTLRADYHRMKRVSDTEKKPVITRDEIENAIRRHQKEALIGGGNDVDAIMRVIESHSIPAKPYPTYEQVQEKVMEPGVARPFAAEIAKSVMTLFTENK